ncbi:MAG: hypothetical protein AAF805_09420 [Planctomycetota bacterium]
MNTNEQLLYLYALLLMFALGANIVHSYLRRTRDLVSATNFFLFGGIVFVGLSSIGCATAGGHYRQYTQNVYLLFIASATWFFAIYIIAASKLRKPFRFGGRVLQSWPESTWYVTLAVIGLLVALNVVHYTVRIPGLSTALNSVSSKGAAFAVAVAFAAWWRNRSNVVFLAVLGAAFSAALLLAVLSGGGRKPFLGVILAVPICYYWIEGRNKTPSRTLTLGSFAVLGLAFVVASYSMTRWFDAGKDGKERNVETSVEQLSNTVSNLGAINPFDRLSEFGQNATEVSLYCIQRSSREPAAWFQSLYLVAVNPIPRSIWPDKPLVFGKAIVEEVRGPGYKVNWGPGIVGHAYNEGGLYGGWAMLAFYAVFLAAIARAIDGCLASQPNNPFLIGALVAVTPNLIALIRGDMTLAYVQIGGGFILLLIVYTYSRVLFGSNAKGGANPVPAQRYATS